MGYKGGLRGSTRRRKARYTAFGYCILDLTESPVSEGKVGVEEPVNVNY